MPYTNIDATLSDTDRTAILGAINLITAKLPFLINLTPGERMALPKMGNLTQSFVAKALEIATHNPQFIPPYVDVEAMAKDYEIALRFQGIEMQVASLLEKLSDTSLAAGSEAYVTALTIYNSLKAASKINAPGAKALVAELAERFSVPGNPETSEPTTPFVP